MEKKKIDMVGVVLVSIAIIIIISWGSYQVGRVKGNLEDKPTCASRELCDYIPPPVCDKVNIDKYGVACCNYNNNSIMVCGLPIMRIK